MLSIEKTGPSLYGTPRIYSPNYGTLSMIGGRGDAGAIRYWCCENIESLKKYKSHFGLFEGGKRK